MKRSPLGRALVGAILVLTLGGPGPGAVGTCGGPLSGVDMEQFCYSRRGIECGRVAERQRDGTYGEPIIPGPGCMDDPATTAVNEIINCTRTYCLDQVPTFCLTNTWTDCATTQASLDACLAALGDISRVGVANSAIVECQRATLCSGTSAPLTEALEEAPYDPEPPTTAPAGAAEVP